MADYPSPCDTCTKAQCDNVKCGAWRARYLIRQRQINGKALQIAAGQMAVKPNVWIYMHPDEYRRYLAAHPCEGCFVREICDNPCPAYLHWYDAWMGSVRKKVGL